MTASGALEKVTGGSALAAQQPTIVTYILPYGGQELAPWFRAISRIKERREVDPSDVKLLDVQNRQSFAPGAISYILNADDVMYAAISGFQIPIYLDITGGSKGRFSINKNLVMEMSPMSKDLQERVKESGHPAAISLRRLEAVFGPVQYGVRQPGMGQRLLVYVGMLGQAIRRPFRRKS